MLSKNRHQNVLQDKIDVSRRLREYLLVIEERRAITPLEDSDVHDFLDIAAQNVRNKIDALNEAAYGA